MKICLINNLYKPYNVGGAESVVEMQVKGLEDAGHEVFVVTTRPNGKLEKENSIYRFRPMNLFYYKNLSKKNVVLKVLWHLVDMFNLHSYYVLEKIFKKEKPDLVITHNLMGTGFLIPLLIKALGIKHIHVLHDVQLAIPSGLIIKGQEKDLLVSGWPAKIYSWLCRMLFSSCKVVISPSKWLMDFYSEKGFFRKVRRVIIQNPVQSTKSEAEESDRTGNYLFIGQFEEHKGIKWLIDLWKEENIKSKLYVVGDGSMRLEVNDNIELLGRLEGEDLKDVFKKVDFLIMPSLCYENSPTVIPLAYQYGKPVICADIGGAGELVDDEETGFLFKAGDKDDFMHVFRRTESIDEMNYKKMVNHCQNKIDKFGLNYYIKKLLELVD